MNFVFSFPEYLLSRLYFDCERMLLHFNYLLVVKTFWMPFNFITKIKIVWF